MIKAKKWIKLNYKWIVAIFFFAVFFLIAEDIFTDSSLFVDQLIYDTVAKLHSGFMTTCFKMITQFGDVVILVLFGFALLFLKNKKIFLFQTLNMACSTTMNYLLKNIFTRPRPNELMLIEESGYSFPSGHTMASVAFYGFLIYIIHHSNLSKKTKSLLTGILIVLIFLIGMSRIYLGVHYATDVIAAVSFNIGYLILYTSLIKKYL